MPEIKVKLPRLHPAQATIMASDNKRRIVRAGRRFGKTTLAAEFFTSPRGLLDGMPCGYMTPTYKMLQEAWRETKGILHPIIRAKNETNLRLELITGGSLDFWSAESPDAPRGRPYAKFFFDEAAMYRDLSYIWNEVVLPTLIDLDGDAMIGSTPRGNNDFRKFDESNNWESFHFTTYDNPHLDRTIIEEMKNSMTALAYQQEIMAEYIDNSENALWQYKTIDDNRVNEAPQLRRIVVAIDPAVTSNKKSDETGIVTVGIDKDNQGYVLSDVSGIYTPLQWARKAVEQFDLWQADRIIGETNNGGDLVEMNLRTVRPSIAYEGVHASRGKATRAEPVAALYEQGKIHHVGNLRELETQMITWSPQDDESPDRVDALVWGIVSLGMTQAEHWYIS
jgi:phage terminase large subunit-like protein